MKLIQLLISIAFINLIVSQLPGVPTQIRWGSYCMTDVGSSDTRIALCGLDNVQQRWTLEFLGRWATYRIKSYRGMYATWNGNVIILSGYGQWSTDARASWLITSSNVNNGFQLKTDEGCMDWNGYGGTYWGASRGCNGSNDQVIFMDQVAEAYNQQQEAERRAAAQREAEARAARERAERERQEAEQRERDRLAAIQREKERIERERREAEQRERDRIEKEKREAEEKKRIEEEADRKKYAHRLGKCKPVGLQALIKNARRLK